MTALRLTNLTEAQIADALRFGDQDESTTLVLDEEEYVLVMPRVLDVLELVLWLVFNSQMHFQLYVMYHQLYYMYFVQI